MTKSKTYNQFTQEELDRGYLSMKLELQNAPKWLVAFFDKAWSDFKQNKWSYDGATFVPERYKTTLFEVAAFLHDYLNIMGIVSYQADAFMFRVMKLLNYDFKYFVWRWVLTRLTFLNIIRHKYYLKDWKGKFPIEIIEL